MKKIMMALALLGILSTTAAVVACGPGTGGADAGEGEGEGEGE